MFIHFCTATYDLARQNIGPRWTKTASCPCFNWVILCNNNPKSDGSVRLAAVPHQLVNMKYPVLLLASYLFLSASAFGQNAVALCQVQVQKRQFETATATCADAAKIDAKIGQTGLGMAFFGLMDWPKAIQAFTVAIESDPRSAALFFYRGQANYFAGNFKTAADDLSRAGMLDSRAGVRIKPQLDAAREIASLLPVQKVPVNTEKRSLEASLAANGLLIQRSVKVLNKEPQAAIDVLDSQILEKINEAIRINKYNRHAYSTRASYYKAVKKHTNALIEYTKAIAIDPSPAPTYVSRGELYAEMKNYQFAIADFSKAIESDHNAGAFNSTYYTARADAYEKAGEKEKALQDLNYMIEVRPKEAFGYGMRASFYLRQKDNAKALAELNKAIELDPKNASSRLSRCRFYNETKRFAAAADDCTVAIDKKEFILSDLAITERAVAYTGLKKYDLAMADLAAAEKSEYTSKAEIFGQRGVIYAAQGKKAEAEAAFNAALKEDPKNRIALDGLKALK